MTTPVDAPRSFTDVLRALVRQLAAATYALLLFLALSSFVTIDGWATLALQGTCGAFGGWLFARVTAGPWWSWLFMGPWLGALDFALNAGVISMAPESLSLAALVRAIGPGSLVLAVVTVLGGVAGHRRGRAANSGGGGNQAQPAPPAPPPAGGDAAP